MVVRMARSVPRRQRPHAGADISVTEGLGSPSEHGSPRTATLALDFFHDHGVEVVSQLGALHVTVVAEERTDPRRARGEHHEHGADLHSLLDRVGDEHDRATGLLPDATYFL